MNTDDEKDRSETLEPNAFAEFTPTQAEVAPPDQGGHEPEMADTQDSLELREFANVMIKSMHAHGDRRTIAYDKEDRCLRLKKEGKNVGKLNLGNLYVEYQSLARGDRDGWLRRVVGGLLNQMELPEDFEDVKPDLLPAIRSRSFSEQLMTLDAEDEEETCSSELASVLLSEHLEARLVYDMPSTMRFITEEDLSTWGVSVDEAFEVAKHNLEELECKVASIERHLVTFVSGDSFDATRMLMIDRIRSLGLSGDPVAMPVTRDILFLTGSEDEDGLRMMAECAKESLDQARPICWIPHRLHGDTWQEWMPPTDSPVFDRFRALRLRQLSGDYSEQQELLNRINDRTGTDIFVASFYVAQNDGQALSCSVWTKDATTLLPETEYVLFFSGVPVVLVPWDRVRAVVGSLMKRTDFYPVRWFVDAFPTAEQFEAMGTASMESLFGISEPSTP